MESSTLNNDLRVEVTNKQILSIALPITLAILIPQINMLTNSIFLGQLSTEALGNAGITGVYYLVFAVAGHGLNSAMQSVFSRYAGSGDTNSFKTILSQGIRISLIFALVGILFTWLAAPFILQAVATPSAYPEEMGFLRIRIFGLPFLFLFQMGNAFLVASLNSRLLIVGFVVEASINIILDYLLIQGRFGFPALGFNGAAVASVIAEVVGMLTVYMVLLKTGLKKQYALLKSYAYNEIFSHQILKISAPLVGQYVISLTTWLIFFFLIEGLNNPTAKAISNTMRSVFGLAGVFIWAFAGATNTMVSNLMGQRREKEVIKAITRIMLWSVGLAGAIVLLLNMFPHIFFSLFAQDDNFIQHGIPVVRTVSVGIVCMSMANIWLNGVTGTGKTKINLLIEIVAIILYMGYTFYFTKFNYISLAMAWSNEIIYWLTIFTLSFIFLKSKKWTIDNG